MTPKDQWGVTPDEGFEIPFSRAQWDAWDRERSRRDVLRHEGEPVPESDAATEDESFEDSQLAAAVEYIQKRLRGENVTEESAGDVPNPDNSQPEEPKPSTESG